MPKSSNIKMFWTPAFAAVTKKLDFQRSRIDFVQISLYDRNPNLRDESFEKSPHFVIPAYAGIQNVLKGLDYCFRRNDDFPNFRSNSKLSRDVSMQRLVIHVKDDAKLNALMSVLNEINFIEVEREEKEASGLSRHGDLRKLFGIWENRDISLADIRQKAWR